MVTMANTNDRLGAVVVFKPGTTYDEAKAALEKLRDALDLDYLVGGGLPTINSFDEQYGGPVWYVP